MLLDIFNTNNSIIINYKSIQLFGLQTAAYLYELITINKKAILKNKMVEENYFKLDRKYITTMLNLTNEEQLVADSNLIKLGILKKHPDNPDIIQLNINLYLSLLSDDDVKLVENVKKEMAVLKPKGVKQSQRQQTINELKNYVSCSNYELLTALRDWVDGVYANPKGFLSKASIKEFQNTLNNYSRGDLDVALSVVKIATIQGWKNCEWAINTYEKDKKINNKKNIDIRITEQKVADKSQLSSDVF